MKYLDYREQRRQGTFNFPIAFYHIDKNHPRYDMPCHWHPECEIIRIIDGFFPLTADEKQYLLKTGDMVFLQDGVIHGGTPSGCVYECVVFDMKLLLKDKHICQGQLQAIMNHELLPEQRLPEGDLPLCQAVDLLFSAMQEKYEGYEFVVQGALYQLIGIMLHRKLYTLHSLQDSRTSYRLGPIKQALAFIEEHYAENITLEQLAGQAGMNPNYFCRFFRQITQRTPIDYVNYYRVECAREQLSATDATITEVALGCGFNDISYFIKTFRRHMGMTPGQYLKTRY